ncbi:MAG: P-loop NTPase fold protein, partial [Planctomycetota bacterium]
MDAALEQDIWDSTPIQGERVFQSEDGSLQVRVGSLGGPGEAQHLLVQRWQTEEKRDLLRHVALDPTEALLSQLPVEAGDPVLLARLSNGAELAVVNQEDRGNFEALGAALNDVAERIEPRPTLDPSPQSASLWIMAAGLTPMELETILEVLPHRIASKFAGYGGALDLMLDYGTSLTRGQLASASDSIQTYLGVTAVEQPEIEADPEDAPEPEDAKPPQPSRDDLTPFLSDAAAPSLDADALDRAAIARAVAEKVRQVWPNHYQPGGSGSPFIVHLSGRWGSGKSSILSFLRDILQKEHREPWVVV